MDGDFAGGEIVDLLLLFRSSANAAKEQSLAVATEHLGSNISLADLDAFSPGQIPEFEQRWGTASLRHQPFAVRTKEPGGYSAGVPIKGIASSSSWPDSDPCPASPKAVITSVDTDVW